MANVAQVELLQRSVAEWNTWREVYREESIDLSRAKLSRADLRAANLSATSMSKADLSEADLSATSMSKADLSEADLSGANLRVADLDDANLSGANLSGADLSEAVLSRTVFAYVDLRAVKGLLYIDHLGPSIIDLPTVQLPQDGSALHFLRGAGVPDAWIDVYRSMMQSPIQYYSCFISYASPDLAFAKRLHADLQDRGVRCWFAPHDLVPGDRFRKKIDEAIHLQDKLLLILSKASMQSNWVDYEVDKALTREVNQKRTILFPVRIDESVFQNGSSWARELREERHIGDFTRWERSHALYQERFTVLLTQLKAGAL